MRAEKTLSAALRADIRGVRLRTLFNRQGETHRHAIQSLSTMPASAGNVSSMHPFQSRWSYVALLFLAAGVVVSAFTLVNPYSY
jgi:hypothetical protein